MRLFVCTLLAADDRAFYDDLIGHLVARHSRWLRPIPRDSAHLTYAFAPSVDPGRLPAAVEALETALAALSPAEVSVERPAVLVAGRDARLIHAPAIDVHGVLTRVTQVVAATLAVAFAGAAVDPSRSPHVTLARFKRGVGREAATPILAELARLAPAALDRVAIDRVDLISSELSPTGQSYTVLASRPIGRMTA